VAEIAAKALDDGALAIAVTGLVVAYAVRAVRLVGHVPNGIRVWEAGATSMGHELLPPIPVF